MKEYNVSIIIPIYNAAKYIERCAHSLFNQTFNSIEYVFIDDCSQDDSVQLLYTVLDCYKHRKDDVKLISLDKNSGSAFARYIGFKNTLGEYIIHCDSDDWFLENAVELLYNEAVKGDYDIVMCDWFEGDGLNTKISKQKFSSNKKLFLSDILMRHISASLWNKLIKRSIYSNENILHPKYSMMEDFVLFFQMVYFSNKMLYIEKPLYYYYDNLSSLCKNKTEQAMLNRCKEAEENVKVVVSFLYKYGLIVDYKGEVVWLKYYVRVFIWPLLLSNYRKYYSKWINIFPEINKNFIFEKKIPLRYKFIFSLTCIGVYPVIYKILNKLR